jgi:hypothetical protein
MLAMEATSKLFKKLLTTIPYKFLTIRISPSFCERISFAPWLVQNRAATLTLKTTSLCLMKGQERKFLRHIPPSRLSEPDKGSHRVASEADFKLEQIASDCHA